MKTIQEIQKKMASSISLKIFIIGFLALLLLIPAAMIQDLILERQTLRDDVVREISDKWGKPQEITGPILAVPWFSYVEDEDKVRKITKMLYILPETLFVDGEIKPEIRYRSIYKVVVYESKIKLKGSFLVPSAEELKIEPENIDWENAFLSIGIPDMRGIQNEIIIKWGDKNHQVEPGSKLSFVKSGISADVTINEQEKRYDFQLDLQLNGSKHLYFTPVGKTTRVHINSNWNNPSFTGSYLPDAREITDSGFVANWQVLHLNRNYPQVWKHEIYPLNSSSFGVDLLFPVDEYQKSYRSTKYAIMFISLTFIIFLFIEIINKRRVHPVQYLMVSAGMLIFYTLLLSLSEQFGFNIAYLISSFAVVSLTTYYTYIIFKSGKLMGLAGTVIGLLYVFLFTILQIQEYSLLLGSIGLFLILALVMYLSRKVDWYQTGNQSNNDPSFK